MTRFIFLPMALPTNLADRKTKNLCTNRLSDSYLNMTTQNISGNGELLDKDFEERKGEYTQIDDVCVVGIAKE